MTKSPEWLAEYYTTIGGSKAASVAGVSPYETAYEYYHRRRGELPWDDIGDKPYVRLGNILEPLARELAANETGCEIQEHDQDQFRYNNRYPWAHALPDGWVHDGNCFVPCEIKAVHPSKFARIRLHGLTQDWVAQAVHNMAVLNAARLLFIVIDKATANIMVNWIDRNQDAESALMEIERQFHEHVVNGTMPAPEVDADTLILDDHLGGLCEIVDGDEYRDALLAYFEAKAMQDEAEEIVNEAKDRLKEMMGGPTRIEYLGLGRFHFKQSPGRKTFDAKKALSRYPDLEDCWKTGDPYTTFRGYDLRGKR